MGCGGLWQLCCSVTVTLGAQEAACAWLQDGCTALGSALLSVSGKYRKITVESTHWIGDWKRLEIASPTRHEFEQTLRDCGEQRKEPGMLQPMGLQSWTRLRAATEQQQNQEMTLKKAIGEMKREQLKLHSPGLREEESSLGGLREWWKRMNV